MQRNRDYDFSHSSSWISSSRWQLGDCRDPYHWYSRYLSSGLQRLQGHSAGVDEEYCLDLASVLVVRSGDSFPDEVFMVI